MSIEVKHIHRPDQLICGENASLDLEKRVTDLERDLLKDWRRQAKQYATSRETWKGWCMVFAPVPEPSCCRGYIIDVKKRAGQQMYEVFLCDYGTVLDFPSEQVLPLSPEATKLPAQYFIIRIHEISPMNGYDWSKRAREVAGGWVATHGRQITVQTKKTLDGPVRLGDLRFKRSTESGDGFLYEHYSTHLVAEKVAVLRSDQCVPECGREQSKTKSKIEYREDLGKFFNQDKRRNRKKSKQSNVFARSNDNRSKEGPVGVNGPWRETSNLNKISSRVSENVKCEQREDFKVTSAFSQSGFTPRGRGVPFQREGGSAGNFGVRSAGPNPGPPQDLNGVRSGGYGTAKFQQSRRDDPKNIFQDEVKYQIKVINKPRPTTPRTEPELKHPAEAKVISERLQSSSANPCESSSSDSTKEAPRSSTQKSYHAEEFSLENASDSELFDDADKEPELAQALRISHECSVEAGKDRVLNLDSALCNMLSRGGLPKSFRPKATPMGNVTSNLFKRIKDPDDCFGNIYPSPDEGDPDGGNQPPQRPDTVSFSRAPVVNQNPDVISISVDKSSGPNSTPKNAIKVLTGPKLSTTALDADTKTTLKVSQRSKFNNDAISELQKSRKSTMFGALRDSPDNPFTAKLSNDSSTVSGQPRPLDTPEMISPKSRESLKGQTPLKAPFKNQLPAWEEVQSKLYQDKPKDRPSSLSDRQSSPVVSAQKSSDATVAPPVLSQPISSAESDTQATVKSPVIPNDHQDDVISSDTKNVDDVEITRSFQPSERLGSWEDTSREFVPFTKTLLDVVTSCSQELGNKCGISQGKQTTSTVIQAGLSLEPSFKTEGNVYGPDSVVVAMPTTRNEEVAADPTESKDMIKKMMQGRVFVYSKERSTVADPYGTKKDFPLWNLVDKGISNNRVLVKTNILQNNVIPNVMRGNNVIIADNETSGKSLAYLIPVAAKIMEQCNTQVGQGGRKGPSPPCAVILTGSVAQGNRLHQHLEYLLDSQNSKQASAYLVIQNDEQTREELKRGAEILITTPEVLEEMIDKYLPYFSFESLMYLIIDDTEILMRSKISTLEKLLEKIQHGLQQLSPHGSPIQYIFCGSQWSQPMEDVMEIVENPVVFLGPLQASVFAGVKIKLSYASDETEKLEQFMGVMGAKIDSREATRFIVVCKNNESVRMLQKELSTKLKIEVLTAMHSSIEEDPMWRPGQIEAVQQRWESSLLSNLEVIVCTDAVIKELGIVDATRVLQFDAAENPGLFAQRFSTMWWWFKSTAERRRQKLQPLVSHVFLTPGEPNLVKIVGKLLDSGAELPDKLKDDFEKLRLEREKEERFCPGLIWYGFCEKIDQRKCPRRHMFLQKDILHYEDIPTTGQIEVRLAKMTSISTYYGQLLRHYEVKGGKAKLVCDYEDVLRKRSEFLAEYYGVPENRVSLESFNAREYGAISMDENGNAYVRVQVDETSKTMCTEIVRLYCLDTGNLVHRRRDEVFKLPEGYDTLPDLVVELIVANMKPPLGERSYLLSHQRRACQLTERKEFVGRICLALGQRIWVDTLKEVTTGSDGRKLVGRSLRKTFFERNFAEDNPEHMKKLYELCEKIGLSCKVYENLLHDDFCPSFYKTFYQKDERVQWAHLPLSTEDNPVCVTVLTSYMLDPDLFVCYHDKFKDQLLDLLEEMNNEIEEFRLSGKYKNDYALRQYYEEGMVVAVKDRVTEKWERAVVTCIKSDDEGIKLLFDIYLVDIGEELFELDMENIHPIPSKFVKRLPFQAITIRLSHVVPKNRRKIDDGPDWPTEAISLADSLIFPDGNATRVDVSAYRKLQSHNCSYGNEYAALVFIKQDELGDKLVQEGFAFHSADEEELVAKLNSALLKHWNDLVDEAGVSKGFVDSEEEEGDTDLTLAALSEDEEGWDFQCGENVNICKAFLGIDVNQVQARREEFSQITPDEPGESYVEEIQEDEPAAPVCKSPVTLALPGDGLKKPKTTWKQLGDHIILSVDLPDVKSYEAEVTNKKILSFKTNDPPGYGFEITLLRMVEEKLTVEPLGSRCKIVLQKRMRGQEWERLTKENRRLHWLKREFDVGSDRDDGTSSSDEDGDPLTRTSSQKTSKRRRTYQTINYESSDSSSSDIEDCPPPNLDEGMMD